MSRPAAPAPAERAGAIGAKSLRRLLLAAALLVSSGIVVSAMNPAPHSGGDNAGYLALAHGLLRNGTYTDVFDPEGLPHTKYPPVFPAILALMMALGARSWVAFKATAAVSTVAAVGLTWLWAERRLAPAGAFAVAILFALSPAVVYYSHWILSDPVFLALTMAAVVALERASEEDASPAWLPLGVAAAGLALFTRQAGLPLVAATLGWLGLRGRWRALGATAVAIGVPALAWWWRGRGGAVASYGEEFWMVNPYDPGLGTVGVLGLVPRALTNLGAYALQHVPAGIVGAGSPLVRPVGVGLSVAGVAGWVWSARARLGPVELFFPLYAGLILLWPEVWAGDRFALPLFPLLLVYGALALRRVSERLPSVGSTLLPAAALLVLLLPAARSWGEARSEARACASLVRRAGAFSCYGPAVEAFAEAATWAGAALPEGSVVLSRKPRHFYLLSGLRSRTFPFDEDPAALLALADTLGARYVLLDQWDGLAARYVGAAVRRRPGAFCFVRGFGDPGGGGAQILGIAPPPARVAAGGASAPRIDGCGEGYLRAGGPAPSSSSSSSSSSRVPLLDRSGS